MITYQVIVHANMDQLLMDIRNRLNKEYRRWPSREFICRAAALRYAFLANLSTGRECSIKTCDPDQYRSLRLRVEHILGVDQDV